DLNIVTLDDLLRLVPTKQQDDTDERYTPHWVVDAARQVLGRIDTDPATCAAAQAIVQARTPYTKADNGLLRLWSGTVWCNPPFSDPLPWVKKLIAHYRAGDVPAAILLLNLAGTPEWAHMLWRGGYPVCVVAKRMEFFKVDGTIDGKNRYDQFIWYL